MDKRIVAWGAGNNTRYYISQNIEPKIEFIIDNDLSKRNSNIEGIQVYHPSDIKNWNELFIIVLLTDYKAVEKQLLALGLEENTDFYVWIGLNKTSIPTPVVEQTLGKIYFRNSSSEVEEMIRTKEDYDDCVRRHYKCIEYEDCLIDMYGHMVGKTGGYAGFCSCCNKESYFTLNYQFTFGGKADWRESGLCPNCFCNSRIRYMVDHIMHEKISGPVYINECITQTYKVLKGLIPELVGSEYYGSQYKSGEFVNGIMHQDAMNLSFDDEAFQLIISNDVYEHVSDYNIGFREAYRCLKKGGKFIFTVPIYTRNMKTTSRAHLDENGEIVYDQPPYYHGNPLSNKGSLVFHEFGWDILDILKNAGFKDAYMITYFSAQKAYFGKFPLVIEAIK
jgi:hypothetical protein